MLEQTTAADSARLSQFDTGPPAPTAAVNVGAAAVSVGAPVAPTTPKAAAPYHKRHPSLVNNNRRGSQVLFFSTKYFFHLFQKIIVSF